MIFLAEGAGASTNSNLWIVVIGAAVSVVTAFIVPVFTMRTNSKNVTQQQQQAVMAQGNALYDRLKAACDEAERERDEARKDADTSRQQHNEALEELARLRHRIWAAGFDPETIGREPPPHARPDRRPGR